MPLNVVTPADPKDPSMIYKFNINETYSGDLEGILVLCFLAILLGVFFKVIEIIFVVIFVLISIFLTARNGEINIVSILPMIIMVVMTSGMTWLQQKNLNKRQLSKFEI
ncbi:conserved Plasmodium protein, unknown function [Plasmodium vivax]|uniref:Uncharacterized protein n=6 Tax=Plasmodium vivax TaxID=5855 RepID=A5K013_PLAVS|nr:hypothetical protein, conserved [Plasmodium vivax]KMZ78127.1 hypothetical protein PVIIG_00814 [Plasmodium vivax India VII]KMZ84465.1 hypothetical protein PVBG_00245 [Plasmodium vivax Brazil I]KMZ90245.1 hypothetical protein PVMG_01612 [Plasmodium vivax Mauritania I]KMZ96956.1 hypothetical protein PVNG_01780 [Plasmodium vivax North Korean]EDL47574.1 hypothetical protein, conserved [Plasmodium vivax]|eukprot:XP_001617301.1 hypothetical protein [Plasmodium vivax Sal-1]